MVPIAAILVIGDDDGARGKELAAADIVDDPGDMAIAGRDIGIAGMLVVAAERLVEDHRRQVAGGDVGEEVGLVLEMLALRLGAVGEIREIGEGLVVVLEARIGLAGKRIVPAARIPRPADILFRQAVADRRHGLRRQQPRRIVDRGRMGLIGGKDRVHRIAVRRDLAVLDEGAIGTERRHDLRRRIVVARRAGADRPEVVEERAAKRGMEEIVGERELAAIVPQPHLAAIVIAHGEALGVGDRGEFVHLAAVDLRLLLVIAVDEIGNLVALRHVTVDEEWTVRQSSGEARIRTGRLLRGVVDRRQLFCVGRPVAVDLAGGSSRLGEAVSARKIAEQIIETVILQIDDARRWRIAPRRGRRR